MKELTGELFHTSFGLLLVPDDQEVKIAIGDVIWHEGKRYEVKHIISPTNPNGKWSFSLS